MFITFLKSLLFMALTKGFAAKSSSALATGQTTQGKE
jgi:hypothetical protein